MVHRTLEGQRCWAECLGTGGVLGLPGASTTGGRQARRHMASLQARTAVTLKVMMRWVK